MNIGTCGDPYCPNKGRVEELEEVVRSLKHRLNTTLDPMGDLIQANRDAILEMHEEAIRRIRPLLERSHFGDAQQAIRVLDALSLFHPMHGESWKGWPEGT